MDLNVVEHKVFYTEVLPFYVLVFECSFWSNDGVRILIAANTFFSTYFKLSLEMKNLPFEMWTDEVVCLYD